MASRRGTRHDELLARQAALAEFGELALRTDDLDHILNEACRLVGRALRTDLAKVLERQPDGRTLLVRAGVGWEPGVVGRLTVSTEEDTSTAYALATGEPAVSTRSATGAGVRLGWAGRGGQVLLEDLARGAVAEATARGVVEPVGEAAEPGPRERLGLAVAGQEAADAAVRVLDAPFLPGGVRVAKVAGHVELAGQLGVGGELGPAVEGDRPAGVLGQTPEGVGDAGDHRRRALVLVRQQEGETALPLDQGGHVRLAVLLAEDQQVGLPGPERLAPRDLGRPILDPALARDRGGARPAAVAAPAPPPGLGQVAVQAVLAALRAVDVAVDGLVADRRPAVRLVPETPRDLLRRPAGLQALGHVGAQALVGGQLSPPPPASAGGGPGGPGGG